jgi:hypothetical protein
MRLDVNSSGVFKFTRMLEKMQRSALPSAIRGALNKAVFDVKTNTMPASADVFTKRQPNFFKANSKFENASGFNVDSMKATVGFTEHGLKGGNNYSVKDLEQQEYGGDIDKKGFIPLAPARTGNNPGKSVRANSRLKSITKIVNPRDAKAKNAKQAFVKSVAFAGKGGFVLGNFNGKQILWRVNSLKKVDGHFKLTALYSFKQGRKAHVKATGFMRNASLDTAKKLESFYIEEAKRQIAKLTPH